MSELIEGPSDGPKQSTISNPWNKYQHQHRKKGLTSSALALMYKEEKQKSPKP